MPFSTVRRNSLLEVSFYSLFPARSRTGMFASRLEITESALGILALKTRFSLVQLLGIQVLGIILSWDLIDWLLSMH